MPEILAQADHSLAVFEAYCCGVLNGRPNTTAVVEIVEIVQRLRRELAEEVPA